MPTANSAIDIAALVEGAARMGVQGQENLLTFAKTAARPTAFELPAAELAENMGKIANLYKIPISNIEQLGDAINFLDDNAQSKGGDIINVLQRMGGVADKLDFKKAAALRSTFLGLGSARGRRERGERHGARTLHCHHAKRHLCGRSHYAGAE